MIPDKNEFIDVLDISGYNYIDRVYSQKLYLPEYLLRPGKLCLGTETTYSINNFLSYRDNPYVLGEFLWVGIDYLGESGKYPVRGVNMGLLDMACNESNEYYLRKSYWSDQPTVHIAVSTGAKPENEWSPRPCESKWNWILNETLPVYVYTNCDEIELVLNEKTLGTKIVDKNLYYALWNIKYEPGNLEAIGYINKEKVTCHTLYTTGNAYQIFARPEKITLSADGKDITLVEIAIQDSKGNPVLDEDIEITVNVSGEAKLIGLDSGEMNYEGLFKTSTRKTYHGKLLAAIQSTKNSGPATIKLESEKLKSFQIQLQSR